MKAFAWSCGWGVRSIAMALLENEHGMSVYGSRARFHCSIWMFGYLDSCSVSNELSLPSVLRSTYLLMGYKIDIVLVFTYMVLEYIPIPIIGNSQGWSDLPSMNYEYL